MEISIVYRIMTFFDNIDDMLNNFVDRVELTPVQITSTLYITGFRRSQSNFTSIDVHLKEIRKVKLENTHTAITDDGGWYMMEPDGEMWVNSSVLSEQILKLGLDKFITTFGNLNSFHLMLTKWRDDGDTLSHVEVALFENKRVACKEALAIRKIHKNVTTKFEMYNKEGELMETPTMEHEPTDFELITAKAE
jgi:hypothetical protein